MRWHTFLLLPFHTVIHTHVRTHSHLNILCQKSHIYALQFCVWPGSYIFVKHTYLPSMEQLGHKIVLVHFFYPCFRFSFRHIFLFAKYYCSNQCLASEKSLRFLWGDSYFFRIFAGHFFFMFAFWIFVTFLSAILQSLLSLNAVCSSEIVKFKPYMMVVVALFCFCCYFVTFSLEKKSKFYSIFIVG